MSRHDSKLEKFSHRISAGIFAMLCAHAARSTLWAIRAATRSHFHADDYALAPINVSPNQPAYEVCAAHIAPGAADGFPDGFGVIDD